LQIFQAFLKLAIFSTKPFIQAYAEQACQATDGKRIPCRNFKSEHELRYCIWQTVYKDTWCPDSSNI